MNDGVREETLVARRGSRRRWYVAIAVLWSLGAVAVYFFHGWLLDEIVAHAAARGVALSDCRLDLGITRVGLDDCSFALRPDGRALQPALASVAVGGTVERVEVELDGLTPSRLRVQNARVTLRGQPNLRELAQGRPSLEAPDFPVDVERSALSWQVDADGPPVFLLSDLSYRADVKRLSSRFEIVRRAHGQLSLGPEGLEVTLGDPIAPEVRLIVRVLPKAERAEVSLDLRRVPLRTLEGPWLQITDTLRPIELEGRIFATIPLGLSMDVPGGDLHLTLHGLQFPVPRELEGLLHQSPPRLSGKFSLSRSFDRMSVADLSFLTGELAMRGGAEFSAEGRGLALKVRANGPLPCRAIAESAATAHADSALARLAGNFAQRALSGSVEVATAIDGHTSDLEHARVLETIGIGCGLAPLPLDLGVSKELLDRLPVDILPNLPRLDGTGGLPKLRVGRLKPPPLPGLLDLAPPPEREP